MAQFSIPNEYTACESYRGCVIALRNNLYSIFERSSLNPEQGARWPEHYANRADARRSIDFAVEKGLVA